ncbi:MAG: TonB-dependent receptor [Sphingomonas sp. SCN 67-18]|nr:MAG: TonB-dependent receptor [Sphingomonas sp. SCN 67-18]
MKRHLFLGVGVISLALGMIPSAALAQDAAQDAADDHGIADIVVTAQKRSESAQKVPIAISAFSSIALQERAVGNVSQLSAISPNVNLDSSTPFSGSQAVLAAFIRGIGADDFAFNIDPGVGIYVDGVYLARSVGANQDLLDVERIEILKGPQGTLFGRNTIGGAVSIVTRDPGKTLSFKGDVTAGSYQLLQARGSADIPLADGIYSSFTFGIKTRNGYVHRVPFDSPLTANTPSYNSFAASGYNSPQREGDEDNRTMRAKLKFDTGGALRATLSGDYTSSKGGAPNTLLGTAENLPGPFAPPAGSNIPGTAFDPTASQGFLFAGLYNFCIGATQAEIANRNAQALCGPLGTQFPSQNFGQSTPVNQVPGFGGANTSGNPLTGRLPFDGRFISHDIDTSYATGNSFSQLEIWGLNATLDYDVSDALSIKSISAYRESDWKSGVDADGSPLNILQLSFAQKQWQISQELQLTGNALDDRLKYVLGAYYFKEKGSLHDFVTFDEGLLQVDGPNRLETENYAAFGQIDFKPVEWVGLTVGGRYTHESKQFEGGQQDLNGILYKAFGCADADGNITPDAQAGFAPPGVTCQQALHYPNASNPLQVYPAGVNHLKFNNFSPKLGIQLYPQRDLMLYSSWSKGYKTGGWTTRFTNPQLAASSFRPEKATTWEIGFKSTLLDRRLQLNAAAFSTRFRDIQLNFQVGTSPTIGNAGNALIQGFEVETVFRPIDPLTINASVGYIDAHYTSLTDAVSAVSGPNPFQGGATVGGALPKTPDFKLNVSPRYELELGSGGSLTFIGDWTHTSSLDNDVALTFLLHRPSLDIFNASVMYKFPDDRISLTIGGTNLTDERYLVSGANNLAAGVIYGMYNRPAEWYARLGFNF